MLVYKRDSKTVGHLGFNANAGQVPCLSRSPTFSRSSRKSASDGGIARSIYVAHNRGHRQDCLEIVLLHDLEAPGDNYNTNYPKPALAGARFAQTSPIPFFTGGRISTTSRVSYIYSNSICMSSRIHLRIANHQRFCLWRWCRGFSGPLPLTYCCRSDPAFADYDRSISLSVTSHSRSRNNCLPQLGYGL